jgi:hypothetical protein
VLPDLPGWESLPAVTRYHSWAEIAGVALLGALVVAEIFAYKYGHRKDAFVEQQQIATNRRHDEEMARLRLETAQANAKALEARVELEKYRAPRRLTAERKAEIAEKTKVFPDVAFAMAAVGPESIDLAIDTADALQTAGWKWVSWPMGGVVTNLPGRPMVGSVALTGTEIQVHDPALVNAGNALLRALVGDPIFERVRSVQGQAQNESYAHTVIIMIGAKK